MTENQNKLAAYFLELASEEFSNHGCNDLDAGLFDAWSQEEKDKFIEDGNKWNKGLIKLGDPSQMPDWMVMDILAYQLKNN